MNFRKALLFSLPIVVTLTLVGAGFSSWYFKHEDLMKENSASLYVVSDVTKGSIEILEHPDLVVFTEGFGRKEDLTDGIEFYKTGNATYTQDDKIVLKYTLVDANDTIDGNDFRLSISIQDETFAKCVSVTSAYSAAVTSAGYDFSSDLKTYDKTETEDAYFLYTLRLNKAIQYTSSDYKPSTKDNYTMLCDALKNGVITITFNVK